MKKLITKKIWKLAIISESFAYWNHNNWENKYALFLKERNVHNEYMKARNNKWKLCILKLRKENREN